MKRRAQQQQCRRFLEDFRALQESLAIKHMFSAEKLIVELRLTPRLVASLKKGQGLDLTWFHAAYAAMRRHGLLPENTSWPAWLKRYRKKQEHCLACLRNRPKAGRSRIK